MSRPLPRPRLSPRLDVQRLEERATPAADAVQPFTATLLKGTLVVQGTDHADHIVVEEQANGDFFVHAIDKTFKGSDVRRVEIYGNGGDDYIQLIADHINPKLHFSDLLDGGDGNDTIVGSRQNDTIRGGAGNDFLDGGPGNDLIDGGDGDDTLLGGDGSDVLLGGPGNDDLWGEAGDDFLNGGPGVDTFQGGTGRNSYKDDFDLSHPAPHGYLMQDVQQGTGGTCAILSTLADAAATHGGASIAGLITYEGHDTYSVQLNSSWLWGLFTTSDTEQVYFDGTWYDHDAQPARARDANGSPTGPPTGEFWTTIFQRAVLQEEGKDWRDPTVIENYSASEATMHAVILGQENSYSVDKNDATLPSQLRDALRAGAILTAGTPDFGKDHAGKPIDEQDGIVGDHAYAILDVYQSQGEWRVKLYNPWGWDAISDATDGHDDGLVDISWSVFVNRFDDYCRTDL
jgi:hypothetical protein